jgi:transcriptional regulator with XRE-family HTH domain
MGRMSGRYLKAWRKHRKMTQEDVVNKLAALDDPLIPATGASLSRLERGEQIFTERSLGALAAIYGCDMDELLRPPPPEDDLTRWLKGKSEIERARAARMLRAMEATLDEKAGVTKALGDSAINE